MHFATLLLAVFAFLLAGPGGAHAFAFKEVERQAEMLAQQPYQAPKPVAQALRSLTYEEYQGIRFKPEKSLWQDNNSRFQVMLVPPGLYYPHPVKIHVIESGTVHTVEFRKDDFTFQPQELDERMPPDAGFAGFKLTYPLTGPDVRNQFLIFAGSSYFRGVGKENAFGISARGIAIDTGLPAGEQFPSFVEYWLERPGPKASAMTFYALLAGRSLTGAYRFTVTPGERTELKVTAVLFPRKQIELLGVAPLTSMFFYGENTPRPVGEWRPQVHDSDGLLIHDGASGEWLWRPLINPKHLQMDTFATESVRGFGLLQRQTHFADYQDLGARYEKRPSAWVRPEGDWGGGRLVLAQLASASETDDNMVAFWSPTDPVVPGKSLIYSYTLTFGGRDIAGENMGRALKTYVGRGDLIGGGSVPGAYRLIVDFGDGQLANLSPDAPPDGVVSALEGGSVIEHTVGYVEPLRLWRLSILAKPAEGQSLALRAFLKKGGETLTETWTYRLPWDNKILPAPAPPPAAPAPPAK